MDRPQALSLKAPSSSFGAKFGHLLLVLMGASFYTLVFFMILPVMQKISAKDDHDLDLRPGAQAALPQEDNTPPEPEPEPEKPDPPPEAPQDIPLDLASMEMVIQADTGGGNLFGGNFGIKLSDALKAANFGSNFGGEIDQPAQLRYAHTRFITPEIKRLGPGVVKVAFIIDEKGRVTKPRIDSTTNPALNSAALRAIVKYRFDPARSKGKPIKSRKIQPIEFPG